MKKDLKIKAKLLRRQGHSFREISEKLSVSKSTASLWTRREKMSETGKARIHNLIIVSQIKAQKTIWDKNERYLKVLEKNCHALVGKKYKQDDLKVFLALLYWAEGAKTKKNFNFINSDPDMVSVYLKLLRATFNIKEEKLFVWLHLHDYHNRPEMVSFWSKVTGIKENKIHIYNKKNSGVRIREGYKGCIAIRYGDYRIFDEVMIIIKRFVNLKI